ncbi:MAG: DMT family transporter [Devosia sp.]
MSLRDWFWVVLLGTIWGTSFLFNAILIRELGPFWVSALRVTIGAAGCWAVLVALRRPLPREPMIYAHFLVYGLICYAIPFALFPLAQGHLAAGVAAIINAMTPITTVIVSQLWPGGERATPQKTAGVVAGFAGVAVLAAPALAGGGSSQLWAILTCLAATGCYAVSLNYARIFRGIEASTVAALSLTGAAISAVSAALVFEGVPQIARAETWGAALGIGLIATTFAYQVMYRILPRIGATNFTSVTFIAPVSAVILGIAFLGEHVEPSHIAGMVGIFIGLLLIDGRLWRRFRASRASGRPDLPPAAGR